MSETFQVSATERGVIRLFTVNLPADQIAGFTETAPGDTLAPINAALGVSHLNSDFVELSPVSNLEELGLAGYLVEGLGIAESDVAPNRMRLNSLSGHMLIVLSAAFGSKETTITPSAPLKWIAGFVGAGLTFAAVTNTCAMSRVLGLLPHNRTSSAGGRTLLEALTSGPSQAR